MNSVAWFDGRAQSYNSSIKFLGYNDQEFGYYMPMKPIVARDGCKVYIHNIRIYRYKQLFKLHVCYIYEHVY